MNKGLIRGGESTSHDSGNDILYTIKETKQQVLIEGDEYHLCKAALMNNEIHEYKNKTNKQILEDIYTRSSCMVKEGEANVGDFIICKLAVRDKKKRNITGTIAEIVSIMQKEHGCRVVDGAEYEKMKKGGKIGKEGIVEFNKMIEKEYLKYYKEDYDTIEKINSVIASQYLIQVALKNGFGIEEVEFHNEKLNPKNHFQMSMDLGDKILWSSPFIYVNDNHKVVESKTNIELLDSNYETIKKNIRFEKGGSLSKTPAPKKERIYGSKRNPKGTSATGESAKSIKFSESTLETIKNKVDEHNKKYPNKKITLATAKAVVRRGMGAYSSTHRPTIKGGKPNSRVAWGLARLNAFLYKAVKGESKSGKYSQDNDLLNELGIKHKEFANGGSVLLAPNGKRSNLNEKQWHLVRTPEFKAWFGDWEKAYETGNYDNISKVISYNTKGFSGEPLVCSHSSYNKFNQFNTPSFFQEGENGVAYGDTSDKDYANYNVFLSIKNPLELRGAFLKDKFIPLISEIYKSASISQEEYETRMKFAEEYEDSYGLFKLFEKPYWKGEYGYYWNWVFDYCKKNGHDGFVMRDSDQSIKYYITTWVALYPEQIKLADGTNTTFDGSNPDIRFKNGGQIKKDWTIVIKNIKNPNDILSGGIKNMYKGSYKKVFDILNEDSILVEIESKDEILKGNDLYIVFNQKPDEFKVEKILKIKDIEQVDKFADGGEVGFKPPYPINEAGGYEYTGKAKETAKKVDLLSLPRSVDGTHCGNCFFQEQGICVHKGIMLPVTERMCCAVWDNSNSDRSYEKNIEKDKGEIPEKIKSFPKNDNGGYTYSGKALEIAKKYDLITLPKKIEGTNCSNCAWFSPYKDGGFCFKSSIWLPVTARMSCSSWNNFSVKRDWSLFKKGGSMKNNSEDIDTSKWEMPSKSIYRYAEKIRTEHPDIWDKGGNVFGNEAYENLERVIKRGHWLPSEEWMYKKWQAFMARHEGDFRIAGVIANLKWLNWVGKGEAFSKSLIESEIKDKKIEKKANGGQVSTEVENVKRGLRMLVGSNLFRDREYQDEFYYNGKKYYIDFVIGTDNAITEDVMMVVHRDLGGGDNDEIVLAMPFDMNKFDFSYDDFYEVFPKVEYKKLAEGGSVVGKFGDFKYPEMYVPSSLYIPQTIKNQIAKKDLPKKVASFPYDFNLLDAVDIFKNIYGDESGLRDNQSAIYLLGDTIAATDAHKMCFVGLNKKQYGAYYIPKKKDIKFLMDNKEPIEKIFKADESHVWVKNVDKESHGFYSVLPRTLDYGLYEYQSKVDIQSLYRYLYFVTENNLVSQFTKQVNLSYFYNQIQSVISFNADYLIDICELYASFGLKEFYVYCSTPNKAVIFSKNALDKESFITSQLKDNLFSILMPVLNQDVPLGVSDIDYKINVGIYFDLFKNKVMDEKGNPTDLTSKVSILSENEFQFIRSSFNKNYQFVKKNGNLRYLDSFLDNYAEQNGLNDTYYYDMSPKQIKLAFALSWIRPFL